MYKYHMMTKYLNIAQPYCGHIICKWTFAKQKVTVITTVIYFKTWAECFSYL